MGRLPLFNPRLFFCWTIPFNKLILNIIAAAKSLQSCLTLCDHIDGNPPGSAVPGILQARTLEWAAISFSNAWKWKVKVKSLSRVRLFMTPWTAAYQAPPSMGFSRQEYWSGVPLPSRYHSLGKYKLKPQRDATSHLVKWLYSKKRKNQVLVSMFEKPEPSYIVGSVKWYNHLGKNLAVPLKSKLKVAVWPINSTPKYVPKITENTCVGQNLNMNIHNS